ncbi:MAG: phospholipase D/transphosphatidylase, partial [Chthonomonadales bacterium]|nr:phospholipase D/transphosphatidylase [Chthonomonadales bacterium]
TAAQVSRWFDTSLKRGDGSGAAVQTENVVKELIDGPESFKEMVRVIRTAGGAGHFIYMLNWWMTDNFALVPGDPTSRLDALLSKASKAGVEVRAMLWDQVGTQNNDEVTHINQLATGAAIVDNLTLNFGSHHQKILIVKGSEGIIAFCGGIDFNEDRIAALARQAGSPMHDVHCRIQGPAAGSLLQTFIERWNGHSAVKKLPAKKQTLLGAGIALPLPGAGGTSAVQIGRTYGNGAAHAGIGGVPFFTKGYTFAPNGETTARGMFLQAIRQAKKFIYIEDQYLVSMQASGALLAALPNIEHLTILIPHGSISDLPQGNYRRQQFIAPLKKWDKDHGTNKVRIFYLKPPGNEHTYVHSKTWIVDDEFAIIGSANCNRRSWTHDSEVTAGICDQGNDQGRRFAHRLRIKLWAEHLGLDPTQDELKLVSGIGSAALWLKPPDGAKIAPYDENADIERIHTDTAWNTEDPDGS